MAERRPGDRAGAPFAPESRCSPYSARNYRYPPSVERRIVAKQGGKVYSPYTGRHFKSIRETDVEHIVARSEAHDSSLCAAKRRTRRRFARDLLNLTLASPSVNRHQKSDRDAAEWMPPENRCWFAARVVEVRRKYGLTIDRREADAVERVLSACGSTQMVIRECCRQTVTRHPASASPAQDRRRSVSSSRIQQ